MRKSIDAPRAPLEESIKRLLTTGIISGLESGALGTVLDPDVPQVLAEIFKISEDEATRQLEHFRHNFTA